MRVVYVCRTVDEAAPVTATQVRWIATLAAMPQVEQVTVLATRLGTASLPPNVSVRTFRPAPWPRLAASFARAVVQARPRQASFFFVVQGGPYPALLLPFKLALRRPVYQWKAQPHASRKMRFYARWCDDLLFTATESSFPHRVQGRRVVGHGIDTDQFRPGDSGPDRDLVTVGRLSPIKRVDVMVRALARCRERFGRTPTLDVIGPAFRSGQGSLRDLRALAKRLDLADRVRFVGTVEHAQLAGMLPRYRALLNFSGTALDKAVIEAMACGVPVLSTNPCVAEDLPADLRAHCVVPADDLDAQAEALHRAATWDDATRRRLGRRSREHAVEHHSVQHLFTRILEEITAHQQGLRPHADARAPAGAGG